MGKPQQPELGRSGHTPVTEGQHAKEVIQGRSSRRQRVRQVRCPRTIGPGITPTPSRTSPIWSGSGPG